MKKLIQIVSFLALVFVVGGVDGRAQSSTRMDMTIPYDFAIGDKEFDAGKYVLHVNRNANTSTLIQLRDSKYRVVYEGFVLENGDGGSETANLVFDRSGSIAKLTQVRTRQRGFTLASESDKDRQVNLASKKKKKGREVTN